MVHEVNDEPGTADGGLTGKIENELELLRRHVQILKIVEDKGPVGIIKLSDLTDHAQHKVRYSLRVLEEEGLIEPSTQGARVREEELESFLARLGELLKLMSETTEELRTAFA